MRVSTIIALGLALACGGAGAFAQDTSHTGHGSASSPPAAEPGMGHGGMAMGQHGMSMEDMHAHMQAMHDHSKMMEGMTDQKILGEEMKKHLRMMDDMMESMMRSQERSAAAAAPTPHPAGTKH